jgi:hypothetical protein
MLLQKLIKHLVSQVAHAADIAALQKGDRFALKLRRLTDAFRREEKHQHDRRAWPRAKKFHFHLPSTIPVRCHPIPNHSCQVAIEV